MFTILPLPYRPAYRAAALASLVGAGGRPLRRAAWIGDSWSNTQTMGAGREASTVVMGLLGVPVAASGLNGTGLGWDNGASRRFDDADRVRGVMDQAAALPPAPGAEEGAGAGVDLLVVAGSVNSNKAVGSDGAPIRQAVRGLVAAVRAHAQGAGTVVVLTGPPSSSPARDTDRASWLQADAIRQEVAALRAAGDQRVVFTDWGRFTRGSSTGPVQPWGLSRYEAGQQVQYEGLRYLVTAAWDPKTPGQAAWPGAPGAPVERLDLPFSGTGNAGGKKGFGTRDEWLQSDDTHPSDAGALPVGTHLASTLAPVLDGFFGGVPIGAVRSAWAALSPAAVAPPAPAEVPGPGPEGPSEPVLLDYTSDPNPTKAGLVAALRRNPKVAGVLFGTRRFTTGQPYVNNKGNNHTGRDLSQYSTILTARSETGLDLISVEEVGQLPEMAGKVTAMHYDSEYQATSPRYDTYEKPAAQVLRTGDLFVTGRAFNAGRTKVKADFPALTTVGDAYDATQAWQMDDMTADVFAVGPEAPSIVWSRIVRKGGKALVQVASKEDLARARANAETAGAEIWGWLAADPSALA